MSAPVVAPVVLVTGAGRGLGRSVCTAFASSGYTVVATDHDVSLLADLSGVPGFLTAALDVTDTAAAHAVAALVRDRFGRLDVVVNNAGIIGYFPVVETDPETVVRHFQVNTFGALRVVHACLDLLAESRGRVVTVTSESYRLRNPFQAYQSTKLALEGLSDVMRRELAPLGVQVATVRPGAMETALFREMDTIVNPLPGARTAAGFDRFARALAKRRPKRVSSPDEVAAVVLRAARAPRMKPHYEINNMPALKVAALLPARVVDRAVGATLR